MVVERTEVVIRPNRDEIAPRCIAPVPKTGPANQATGAGHHVVNHRSGRRGAARVGGLTTFAVRQGAARMPRQMRVALHQKALVRDKVPHHDSRLR